MLRVLVVEDDPAQQRLVTDVLEGVATVRCVSTIADAEALGDEEPHVVLCDLSLPDAEGAEVAAAMGRAFPRATIVATSGAEGARVDAAMNAGAHAFVLKGGELDGKLVEAVRAAADRAQALARSGGRRAAPAGRRRDDPARLAAVVPVAMLGLDDHGRCTWANERFDTLAGLAPGGAVGTGWTEALHPADRRAVLEAWHTRTAVGGEFALAVRFARGAGDVAHVRLTVAPVDDGAGALAGWVAVAADETGLRVAERAEADRRAQLEGIIDASPNAIVLKDPQSRLVLANQAAEGLLGADREQLVGASLLPLMPPGSVERVRALDRDVLTSGQPREDEVTAVDQHGEPRVWLTSRFPVRDADGVLTGVGVIGSDITERRRLEREVARHRIMLEEAQEIAGLASWEWDVGRERLTASGQLPLAVTPELATAPAVRAALADAVHPDDRGRLDAHILASLRSPSEHDITVRTAATPEHVLRLRWRSSASEHGDTVLVGTTQDITDEHRRELAQREAEEQLRLVFDHAPIGLALTDLEGRWIRVNAAACAMLGRRVGELLGHPVADVLHPADRDIDRDALARVVAGELDVYEVEKRCLRPDGSLLWVLLSVSAVRQPYGGAREIVLQLLDITVRRDLEARLTELAEVDPVTGLFNEQHLRAELERAITWRRRSGETATLVMIELEETPDERALRDLSALLRRTVRRSDIVVRCDGERFALLLPGTTVAGASAVVAKTERALLELGSVGRPAFGTAELTGPTPAAEELIAAATAAAAASRRP